MQFMWYDLLAVGLPALFGCSMRLLDDVSMETLISTFGFLHGHFSLVNWLLVALETNVETYIDLFRDRVYTCCTSHHLSYPPSMVAEWASTKFLAFFSRPKGTLTFLY